MAYRTIDGEVMTDLRYVGGKPHGRNMEPLYIAEFDFVVEKQREEFMIEALALYKRVTRESH